MTDVKKAYFFAILSVLMWSTVASAFKLTLNQIDFIQLLFFASIFSAITLFAIVLAQKKVYLIKRQRRKQLLYSAGMGFLNPFFYYLVLFKAYAILPAQEAQPLNYSWPVVLSLLSVPLLKQKLSRQSIIGILVSFVGVLIISTKGNLSHLILSDLIGDFLAVFSSIIWSLFWIYNLKDARDPVIKLTLSFFFGCIYIVLLVLFLDKPVFIGWLPLFGTFYVGLFEMGITFFFWLKALSYAENSASVANLVFLSPFLSLIFIRNIVGEKILLSSILGLIFIVSGIVIQKYKRKR